MITDPLSSTARISEIEAVIAKLRALTQFNVQDGWRYCLQDLPVAVATQFHSFSNWATVELNAKNYVVWSAGRQVMWLGQTFTVPQALQGYPLAGLALRLALTWWAESAEIFVNGQRVQEGDLFDSSARVLLSAAVAPGDTFTVALRLVSPGHDIGGLMRSRCLYESPTSIDPGFVADELAVLLGYVKTFAPEKLDALAAEVAILDWGTVSGQETFARSLETLRQTLQSLTAAQNFPQPKQRHFHLLGHAHLDMAWLWPVSETWDVAVRTFESVLALQDEFPSLTFCHSTPALYAWVEEHRPELFAAIGQKISQGRWEVVGGMWVEPEINLLGGESIVRQILYGQRYVREKFGQISPIAWITDSFGFCWQLPQFLAQGGINYFVTQKLHWNDSTKFPHGAFWWQAPDGSQIFSIMSPPNITGVMDTHPITMTNYSLEWERQTHLNDIFWLPGVGDHGGGPTRDMLEVAQRWQHSPFFPHLTFTRAEDYLQKISRGAEGQRGRGAEEQGSRGAGEQFPISHSQSKIPMPHAPIWNDELYLELHRGCYTNHADQKRWNRRCEGLLYQAELLASLATITTGAAYPKWELEDAWKKVLFNQFHDILPGTSIPEVFVEANAAWQAVEQVGSDILEASLNAIASQVTLPSPPHPDAQPIFVFNPLNWQRRELVTVALPNSANRNWSICDLAGEKIPSQFSGEGELLFLAGDIPSIGYRVFWLCPTPHPVGAKACKPLSVTEDFVLENDMLRVVVDPKTGDLSRVFDKRHQRDVLNGAGNQLQAFEDSGQYWDAWNIDPNYAQHPLPPTQLRSIEWIERGSLRSRLRVVRQLGQSQFCQDYLLAADSPVLKIATTVDWQERHVLVKAAFPLNLEADSATYEIACGAIDRPTRPQTPAEKAKWEVCGLRWANLGDEDYGVSLLNDCKYGYDAQPSQLRLTLLRGSTWPDPDADFGIHHFTYALYPHQGSWQAAGTVHRGYELNLPLLVRSYSPVEAENKPLPQIGCLLDLQAENLILMALKRSEDNSEAWILRCYECVGESADATLTSEVELSLTDTVDLLERSTQSLKVSGNRQSFLVSPWRVASFQVKV